MVKVTLCGIIGKPFDAEVKRVYIGDASHGKGMLSVACACHESVHDQLLLTLAVVNCLISNDPSRVDQIYNTASENNDCQCSDDDEDDGETRHGENVDDDSYHNTEMIDKSLTNYQNDEITYVDECVLESTHTLGCILTSQNKPVDLVNAQNHTNQSGLITVTEPDTLRFDDILPNQWVNYDSFTDECRRLSEEQK